MNTQSKNGVVPVGCTLNIKQVAPSLDLATHIASLGFCVNDSPELRLDVKQHLGGGQVVCKIELHYDFGSETFESGNIWSGNPYTVEGAKWSETVGFAIFTLMGERILYLSGIILLPAYQGKGIAKYVIDWAKEKFNRDILVLRTQSALMWAAMNNICDSSAPTPWFETSGWAKKYGQEAAKLIGSNYPIHQGCYGGPLYGVKPIHRDPKIQKWWDSICSFERGDAVICVGKLL